MVLADGMGKLPSQPIIKLSQEGIIKNNPKATAIALGYFTSQGGKYNETNHNSYHFIIM
jgi:hypothetical protein